MMALKKTAQPPPDAGTPPRGRPENFGTGDGKQVGKVVRGDKRLPKSAKGKK
jgi:hypothetical protein